MSSKWEVGKEGGRKKKLTNMRKRDCKKKAKEKLLSDLEKKEEKCLKVVYNKS